MPLYLTASHASRVRKPADRPSSSRRISSSPFSGLSRTKPHHQHPRLKSVGDIGDDFPSDGIPAERLDDTGTHVSLAAMSPVSGVIQAISHVHGTMFSDLPERAAGMNSTRIAEVLNFRKRLPPMASLAHVYGLLAASTRTEREISTLIASSDVRKLHVRGRGNEVSGLSEFLVLTKDLESLIQDSSVDSDVADRFIQLLRQNPRSPTVPVNLLAPSEITRLRNKGFLVSPGIAAKQDVPAAAGTRATAIPTISRQASGTAAAAGGEAAFDSLGGIGNARTGGSSSNSTPQSSASTGTSLILSIPHTGAYLRLIDDARTHLLDELAKSSYREAPLYLLKDRWDGAVADIETNKVAAAKRMRGEFIGVLPGKTKKWKRFSGLDFDWILHECLGAGLLDLFQTNSVGYGVRAV